MLDNWGGKTSFHWSDPEPVRGGGDTGGPGGNTWRQKEEQSLDLS